MFKRLANLWKGFLSLWISDIEKEHPEIAYENAINSMVEKYSKLKTATASIIRRREDMDERFKRATAELAQTEAELDTAVSTNQDDLAVILIQKKNQLTTEVTELKAEMEQARGDADAAGSLLGVQSGSESCRASAIRCLPKCNRRRPALRFRNSWTAFRSMPRSRLLIMCVNTSRPQLLKQTWVRNCRNPRSTRGWRRYAIKPATCRLSNSSPN